MSLAVARASSYSCWTFEIDYGAKPGLPLTTVELGTDTVPDAQKQGFKLFVHDSQQQHNQGRQLRKW